MEPRSGARLTPADNIAIALCYNAQFRKSTIAGRFQVSVRQIERIIEAFGEKFGDVYEAICKFNKFVELETQGVTHNEATALEVSEMHAVSADRHEPYAGLAQGRNVLAIQQLKEQIRLGEAAFGAIESPSRPRKK